MFRFVYDACAVRPLLPPTNAFAVLGDEIAQIHFSMLKKKCGLFRNGDRLRVVQIPLAIESHRGALGHYFSLMYFGSPAKISLADWPAIIRIEQHMQSDFAYHAMLSCFKEGFQFGEDGMKELCALVDIMVSKGDLENADSALKFMNSREDWTLADRFSMLGIRHRVTRSLLM